MAKQSNIRMKCVLLGDANVGKTSIVLRYLRNKFNEYAESTIGCAFNNCVIDYNGKTYKLDIWDTAGQERYRGLMPMYYRNADIVFLCVDLSENNNNKMKTEYDYWKSQINLHNDNENRIILLIGTKKDIEIVRTEGELREILGEDHYYYLETSSKEDININKIFTFAIMKVSRVINKQDNALIVATNQNESKSWYSGWLTKCNIL